MIAIASLVDLSVPLMRYPFLNDNRRWSLVIGAVSCRSREDDLVSASVIGVLGESALLMQGPQFANHFIGYSHRRLVLLLLALLLRVVILLVQMI